MRWSLPLLVLTATFGGCAEVSFKRGSSAADFDADKDTCRRAIAGTDQSLADCMEGRGWYLHQFADDANDETVEEASVAEDATVSTGTEAGDKATSPANPDHATAMKSTEKKKKPKTPAQPAVIGTWFKFGAGPTALEADQAACVAELGDAHRITSTTQPVSPAMRACMKKRGWFGLESSPAR